MPPPQLPRRDGGRQRTDRRRQGGARLRVVSEDFSVAATGLESLLAHAARIGVETAGLIAELGLDEEALRGPDARIAQRTYNRAWEMLVAWSRDADFGLHFAERAPPNALDVVGHLVLRSATLGEAFERVARLSRILHDAGKFEVERQRDVALVHPGCRGMLHDWPRHIAEYATLVTLLVARAATGASIVPRAVSFKHSAPARSSEHVRLFGVLPVFGARETCLTLAAADLALPISGPKDGLETYLDAYAREVLAKLPERDDLESRVARVVARELEHGAPTIEVVAKALALSPRTLQRRLAESGVSFQTVVDRVRQQYSERYLADERLSLAEIAYLLGFSEVSAFHRAYKRWTGKTPRAR